VHHRVDRFDQPLMLRPGPIGNIAGLDPPFRHDAQFFQIVLHQRLVGIDPS
jgi:hypothetical protein